MRTRAAQDVGRHALRRAEIGLAIVRIGLARDRLRRQRDEFQRAFIDQAVDHAGRDAGILRGFGLRCAAARRRAPRARGGAPASCAAAAGRQAAPRRARAPGRDVAHAQRHAQHHAARRRACSSRPSRRSCAAPPERRVVELRRDVLEAIVQAGLDRDVSAQTTPVASRGPSGTATMSPACEVESARYAVGIGVVERDRHQNVDDARCHAGWQTRGGLKEGGTKRAGL